MLDICSKCCSLQGERSWGLGFCHCLFCAELGMGHYGKSFHASLNHCLVLSGPHTSTVCQAFWRSETGETEASALGSLQKSWAIGWWSSSFSPRGKAGICLLCTEWGWGCYSECLHGGPNPLLSLSRLQVSRVS